LMDLGDPFDVTLLVAAVFRDLSIEYLVGGSVASSVHGMPRATNDVDVVAKITGRHVEPFVAALRDTFYVDGEMIRDAIARRASFNVIHLATMMKVDVFVFDGSELAEEEMRRKRTIEIAEGEPAVCFASPEDIILQKLEWYRKGAEVSDRQWSDLRSVIVVQGDRLDRDYLRRWATRLGLDVLLERALGTP